MTQMTTEVERYKQGKRMGYKQPTHWKNPDAGKD